MSTGRPAGSGGGSRRVRATRSPSVPVSRRSPVGRRSPIHPGSPGSPTHPGNRIHPGNPTRPGNPMIRHRPFPGHRRRRTRPGHAPRSPAGRTRPFPTRLRPPSPEGRPWWSRSTPIDLRRIHRNRSGGSRRTRTCAERSIRFERRRRAPDLARFGSQSQPEPFRTGSVPTKVGSPRHATCETRCSSIRCGGSSAAAFPSLSPRRYDHDRRTSHRV